MHNYVDIESLEDPNQGPSRFQRQKDGAAGSAFNHQYQDGTTHDSSNFLNTAYDLDMNNPYDSSFEIGNRQKRSRFQSGKATQTESDSTKKKDQNKNTIGNACLALIGKSFKTKITMPFIDFQPKNTVLEFEHHFIRRQSCF